MIVDLIVSILIGVLTCLMGFLGATIALKRYANSSKFLDIFEDIFDEIATNEDIQKKIYSLGGLLGSGIRQGVGIGKRGGKMSFQDLAMQFISGFLEKSQNKGTNTDSPSETGLNNKNPFK